MTDSAKLDLILEKLVSLESDTQELKQKIINIENKVTENSLTLENEIRVNIQRVAEGHLDLSRNLHEALKETMKKKCLLFELVFLKLNYVE